jgi:mono/diheme cytochrome c family protein
MTAPRAALALTLAAALVSATSSARAAKGLSPAEARAIFETKCGPCHGKTGQPAPMFAKMGVRAFVDAEWQKSKTDDQLRTSIQNGKPGTAMRSFKGELKPEELEALIRHIRTLPGAAVK